jgi:hypothetical protein
MTQRTPDSRQRFMMDPRCLDGPPRTNSAAVASLVSGVLGRIPFVTGILAVVFGIIGIRKARQPAVAGKGMASAGLALGIVSILAWTGIGGVTGYAYQESKPAGIVAKQFLTDVSTGDISAALANSSGFTAAQLQTESQGMSPLGALQSVSITSFNISILNRVTAIELTGSAVFEGASGACEFHLIKIGGGYKVTEWKVSGVVNHPPTGKTLVVWVVPEKRSGLIKASASSRLYTRPRNRSGKVPGVMSLWPASWPMSRGSGE